jgi:hypothetical protein
MSYPNDPVASPSTWMTDLIESMQKYSIHNRVLADSFSAIFGEIASVSTPLPEELPNQNEAINLPPSSTLEELITLSLVGSFDFIPWDKCVTMLPGIDAKLASLDAPSSTHFVTDIFCASLVHAMDHCGGEHIEQCRRVFVAAMRNPTPGLALIADFFCAHFNLDPVDVSSLTDTAPVTTVLFPADPTSIGFHDASSSSASGVAYCDGKCVDFTRAPIGPVIDCPRDTLFIYRRSSPRSTSTVRHF